MGQILKTSQVGVPSQFENNLSLVVNLRRLTIVFRFYSTLTVEGFNKTKYFFLQFLGNSY